MRKIEQDFAAQSGANGESASEDPSSAAYAVAVFAASSMMFDAGHADDAVYVGRKIAENGYHFIYGGGTKGLMGLSSKAALEAGGTITGYMMDCFHESTDAYPQKDFEKMCMSIAERKEKMLLNADAYIALGGGFGTLDEIVEAGTEQYMGGYMEPPLPVKPIILINRNGIYDPFMAQLDKFIAEGSAKPAVKDFFVLVKDGREAMDVLETLRTTPRMQATPVGNVKITPE